jgi:hypothetical protein
MIEYMNQPSGYQPGVCNIGPQEIRRRQMAGVVGVAAAIALAALLLVLDAPPAARLLVALPLTAGFNGFLQARLHFCATYGLRGIRNLGAIGDKERVEDVEARRADQRKALGIFGAAAAGGMAVAMLFALMPI